MVVDAGQVRFHSQHDLDQFPQRLSQVSIGELVTDLATLVCRYDQPASSQACEVVGHLGSGQVELGGQLPGIVGAVQQGCQDAAPCRVGQCSTNSGQSILLRLTRQHIPNSTDNAVLQQWVYCFACRGRHDRSDGFGGAAIATPTARTIQLGNAERQVRKRMRFAEDSPGRSCEGIRRGASLSWGWVAGSSRGACCRPGAHGPLLCAYE